MFVCILSNFLPGKCVPLVCALNYYFYNLTRITQKILVKVLILIHQNPQKIDLKKISFFLKVWAIKRHPYKSIKKTFKVI